MRPRQRPSTRPAVGVQARVAHRRQVHRRLPVPQLADVEVVLLAVEALAPLPAEEHVGHRLIHPLPADDALAVVARTRSRRGTARAPTPAPPSSAGPARPARRARRTGAPRRASRRCRRRRPCGPCRRTRRCRTGSAGPRRGSRGTGRAGRGRSRTRRADRRGRADPRTGPAAAGRCESAASPSTCSVSLVTARRLVLRLALANGFANRIRPLLPSRPPKRSTSSLALMRSYHTSRWLTWANPRIASRYSRTHAITSCGPAVRRQPDVAAGDLDARGHPLDVPLPRPGQRLVEIVRAEDQPTVGRGEPAEVRYVSVAAGLHDDPGVGGRREVGRHHRGSAAIERERRDEHPPVPDRDQLLQPRRRLRLEHRDRIGSVRRRRPVAVGRRAASASAPPGRAPPTRRA